MFLPLSFSCKLFSVNYFVSHPRFPDGRTLTLRHNDTCFRNHFCNWPVERVRAWIWRSRIYFLSAAPSRETKTRILMKLAGAVFFHTDQSVGTLGNASRSREAQNECRGSFQCRGQNPRITRLPPYERTFSSTIKHLVLGHRDCTSHNSCSIPHFAWFI